MGIQERLESLAAVEIRRTATGFPGDRGNHQGLSCLSQSEGNRQRSILRGQALQQQADLSGALTEFNKALDLNKNSSLAHYRIAEVFFLQRNYQSSANAYREAINGDGEPRWTEVWSRIQLGKIFDITGQRERAVNEYRQGLQTNDNTFGALEEARKYLQKAFERPKARE